MRDMFERQLVHNAVRLLQFRGMHVTTQILAAVHCRSEAKPAQGRGMHAYLFIGSCALQKRNCRNERQKFGNIDEFLNDDDAVTSLD